MNSERPILSQESTNTEIQNFINYIKGDEQINNAIVIPAAMTINIADKIKALTPIRAIAKVSYTSQDKLDVVIDHNNSTASGWVTDSLIKSEETATLSKVSIYLHQLYSKPKVAFSLLEDESSKVEEVLQDKITAQMATAENYAFLYGDGISQPKGILKYDIVTSSYDSSSKTIEGIIGGKPGKLENYLKLIELMEQLPARYLYGASWLMSRNVASVLRLMKDQSSGKFIWQSSIMPGVPDTLLGYPVVICDDMPRLNTSSKKYCPILFGNFYEGYQIAEKPEIKLLKDPFNSKPFVEFYATKRVGGDVVNFEAIKALVLTE